MVAAAGLRLAPRSAQTGCFGAARIRSLRAGGGNGAASGAHVAVASSTAAKRKTDRDAGVIELEIDGIAMRVGRGADTRTVAAVIRAPKATS